MIESLHLTDSFANGMAHGVYGKTALANGVRIVTESIPGVHSLAIGVAVECGSIHEGPEEAGLAHLCEHLVFQGTSTRDGLKIARQIDDAGGRVGGFTTRDYTCFTASVLGDYCFHALDLLGDVLLNPTFPEENLRREKRVAICEIGGELDDPARRVHEMARSIAWGAHALGRSVAGTVDSVNRHTREDLIHFFHRHYTPNRVIIAAAGRLDHADFVSQARDAFWRMLGESVPPPTDEPEFHSGAAWSECASSQAYFCLALPAPTYSDPDRYAVHLLNRMLGGNVSSRLFRRLREEMGLVYDVHSEYLAYRDGGLLAIEGSTQPDLLEQTLREVIGVVRQCLAGEKAPDLDEWWRARTQVRAEHMLASEDAQTRMMRLATQELYFGAWTPADRVLKDIDGVEAAEVQNAARRILHGPPRAALAAAGPYGASQEFLDDLLSGLAGNEPNRTLSGDSLRKRRTRTQQEIGHAIGSIDQEKLDLHPAKA